MPLYLAIFWISYRLQIKNHRPTLLETRNHAWLARSLAGSLFGQFPSLLTETVILQGNCIYPDIYIYISYHIMSCSFQHQIFSYFLWPSCKQTGRAENPRENTCWVSDYQQRCHHTTCSHTTSHHTTCSHTTCHHTTCSQTTCSHAQLVITPLAHTQLVIKPLVITPLAHTQLVITPLAHTQLVITPLAHTQLTSHHSTCSHTTSHHATCHHTTCSHTTCHHTTCSHTTCHHITCSLTQLVITPLAHTQLVITPLAHTQLVITHLVTSTCIVAWQAWHLETSTFVSRGRRGTWWHRLPLLRGRRGTYGTGLAPVARLGRSGTPGRRGCWRHPPSFHVAGVALGDIDFHFCVAGVARMALGWLRWRAWAGVGRRDTAAVGVASVALGDIHLRFTWQAHLLTLTLPHTNCSTPILHHLFSLSCFPHAIFTFLLLLVWRSWHVGLSGPLIGREKGG